jgi:hypothetical protein
LSFTTSSLIAWRVSRGIAVSRTLLRVALVSWELAAPFTLLVAAVVRYAIWPGVLKKGEPTLNLRHPRNIMMHNMNVLLALTETSLLGGIPVTWEHLSMAPIVGCLYVIFSWNMTMAWNVRSAGPQFVYFFFDTTLPGATSSIALIVLLFVQVLFYAIFSEAEHLLSLLGMGYFVVHLLFVAGISSIVMRFRD